jgi:hypothetical protein
MNKICLIFDQVLNLLLSTQMLKIIKKIFPLLILMIYVSSTIGLVISHIHCNCENNDHVKIFSLKQESCTVCAAKEKQEQRKSCCAKKTHTHKQQKGCCDRDVVYLKIISDYASSQPLNVTDISSYLIGNIVFIDKTDRIKLSSLSYIFLKEDIPKISGKDMVCYLHQFKMEPDLIS